MFTEWLPWTPGNFFSVEYFFCWVRSKPVNLTAMKIRNILLLLTVAALHGQALAQKNNPFREIEKIVTLEETEPPLRFLAADEMRGRDTGSPELNIAANYIASQFQRWNVSKVPGVNSYFQQVPLEKRKGPQSASLQVGTASVMLNTDIIVLNSDQVNWSGELEMITSDDEITASLKDKVAVYIMSGDETLSFSRARTASSLRYAKLNSFGAAGLIEIVQKLPNPWETLVARYAESVLSIRKDEKLMPRLWMRSSDNEVIRLLQTKKSVTGSLHINREPARQLNTKNVVGFIAGTDPKLREEYIMICAHYDHLGVGKPVAGDSIYNGARDNAVGTVAMLSAAQYFSKFPAKRSLLFMACTAEERGLLGSEWYVEHPLVPLNKTVFNVTADGAGYNDKTRAIVLGMDRIDKNDAIAQACTAAGLQASDNLKPEMDFYGGSDNFPFAKKGVTAVDFSPGFTGFGPDITKYYHQPADNPDDLDYQYLLKYFKAFVFTNHLIANMDIVPFWKAGDGFEAAGRGLYKK